MTYYDEWAPTKVATKGVLRQKYLAFVGFIILLVSMVLSVWFGLSTMWPFALFGALVWTAFGTAYRKNFDPDEEGDEREWKAL